MQGVMRVARSLRSSLTAVAIVATAAVLIAAAPAMSSTRETAPTAMAARGVLAPSAAAGFVVIVNAGNPATGIKKMDVMRIFMKKMRAWPGGTTAEPVDQKDASPARKEFLSTVIGKDAASMNAYWQSQLFVGRTTPPPVKASDADVIAFVAGAKGAIGYVAPGTTLPETVKVLKVGE